MQRDFGGHDIAYCASQVANKHLATDASLCVGVRTQVGGCVWT